MNVYEHEGKALLRTYGIEIPKGVLLSHPEEIEPAVRALGGRFVLKAQVLSGKRADRGGVVFCETMEEVCNTASSWFEAGFEGQPVTEVLLEARISAKRELYAACVYDIAARGPLLVVGASGGTGVESQEVFERFPLDVRDFRTSLQSNASALEAIAQELPSFCEKLVSAFFEEDARQIEINPLAEREDGSLIALDAKVTLDDAGAARHPEWSAYEGRSTLGRAATARERGAADIDAGADAHRGTAGTYFELDGDIATLFSGGGASLVNMDTMHRLGLRAANYAEYSGNPPKEKVQALARLVLSQPGLRGALIVGGIANFTDIKETFSGIAAALDVLKPRYPIVVRRAGPREQEGLDLLRACAARNGVKMEVFGKDTTMADAVTRMKELTI